MEASSIAEKDLASTRPTRLGLAFKFSVFEFKVMMKPDATCKMALAAYESAIAHYDVVDFFVKLCGAI